MSKSIYDLNNWKTIESNMHMIIETGLQLGEGWAYWNFYEGRKPRDGYQCRRPAAG